MVLEAFDPLLRRVEAPPQMDYENEITPVFQKYWIRKLAAASGFRPPISYRVYNGSAVVNWRYFSASFTRDRSRIFCVHFREMRDQFDPAMEMIRAKPEWLGGLGLGLRPNPFSPPFLIRIIRMSPSFEGSRIGPSAQSFSFEGIRMKMNRDCAFGPIHLISLDQPKADPMKLPHSLCLRPNEEDTILPPSEDEWPIHWGFAPIETKGSAFGWSFAAALLQLCCRTRIGAKPQSICHFRESLKWQKGILRPASWPKDPRSE